MEIIVSKSSGFCYGVKRAVEGAYQNDNSYCLGNLVHNENVINTLKEHNIKIIDNIDNIKDTNVIVRAHGVSKEIYEKAKLNNINLIDYTCPKVLNIHNIVEKYSNDNYDVILCGDINHPENIGTISYCKKCIVINKVEDINNIDLDKLNKVLLISQTTFSVNEFNKIKNKLKELLKNKLIIKNTICPSTNIRQKETSELATKVDLMIVIGGKESSNTKKLYDIASKYTKTLLITSYLELKDIKANKIGVVAGASTSSKDIIDVVNYLQNLN